MIVWIFVGVAFVVGFAAGASFMAWVVKGLSEIGGAIERGTRAY